MPWTTHTRLEELLCTVRAIMKWNELERLRALLITQHTADIADVIDRLDHRDQVTCLGYFLHPASNQDRVHSSERHFLGG